MNGNIQVSRAQLDELRQSFEKLVRESQLTTEVVQQFNDVWMKSRGYATGPIGMDSVGSSGITGPTGPVLPSATLDGLLRDGARPGETITLRDLLLSGQSVTSTDVIEFDRDEYDPPPPSRVSDSLPTVVPESNTRKIELPDD